MKSLLLAWLVFLLALYLVVLLRRLIERIAPAPGGGEPGVVSAPPREVLLFDASCS